MICSVRWLCRAANNRVVFWMMRRNRFYYAVGAPNKLFDRFEPFWPDEYGDQNRPPWWRPFNVLLHRWANSEGGRFHDHPRWSVTIVLRGELVEHTPWRARHLKPGSVVIRSHKFIHRFDVPKNQGRKPLTLFIVGRRNYQQNWYEIEPFKN